MPRIENVEPVRLDGSFDEHVRFPYKTGDEVGVCIFGGTNAAGELTYYFSRRRVLANDLQTGTMVVTFREDEVDTLDPTWTDTVIPWNDDLPTLASVIDEETWDRVEKADTRLIPNGLGGRLVKSVDLPNRAEV
jgi:hypothetical protein